MKRSIFKILVISFVISTIGMIIDGDPKEASILLRFVEYFAMAATIFILISTVYLCTNFIFKKLKAVSFFK